MSRPIEQSLLYQPFSDITLEPGSPWLWVSCQIKAGPHVYVPLKVTRVQYDMDLVNNCAEDNYITVAIPKGDVMNYIAPFQDDLMIEISVSRITEEMTNEGNVEELKRYYRAYLDDQVVQPIESSNTMGEPDIDMANLSEILSVIFRLEEVFVEQMRKMRTGTNGSGVPIRFVEALLNRHAKSIQLDESEGYKGITVSPGFNPIRRSSIHVPDGTELLELPDLVQNEQGGIYKEALGFFLHQQQIHLWPLYKTDRVDTAPRTLRLYISPDPRTKVVERTWRIPEQSPQILELWVADQIQIIDNTMQGMQQYGTGVRFSNPETLLQGGGVSEGNTYSVNRSANAEIGSANLPNKQNVIRSVGATSNPYVEASRLAKTKGVYLSMAWHHSLPTLLTPNMAVEVIYDFQGEVRTINGTLLHALSIVDVLGKGMVSMRFKSITALTVFVERSDDLFKSWVEAGAENVSVTPQLD